MSDLVPETNLVQSQPSLKRTFNLTGAVVMSAGLVIGVGLFTVSTNAIGYLGPSLLLGNLVALVVSVLTSLVYAELAACWPYSGGSYAYAYESWGKYGPFAGFMVAWAIIGGYLAVGAEALAFGNYFLSTLDFLGWWKVLQGGSIPFTVSAILASALILVFTVVNWRGAKAVSVSQKIVMFSMWALMIVSVIATSFTAMNFSNYRPFFPEWFDVSTFAMSATLIWWAYAGQEVIGTIGEEIEFPTVTMPRALILVPFVVFAATATMQWVVVGILPDVRILTDAGAPFALALRTAGVSTFVFLLFMIAEFGGNFSTVNPLLTGSSRVLYALGRDGYLPTALGRLSNRNVPAAAIWIMGLGSVALLISKGLLFTAQITAFMFLFMYGFSCLTLIASRITRPDVKRPFRTPLYPITPLLVIAFVIWMMFSLPKEVIIGGVGWMVMAAIIYFIWTRLPYGEQARQDSKFFRAESNLPPEPTAEEKVKLDKEFRGFAIKVGVIVVLCLVFYAVTYLLG